MQYAALHGPKRQVVRTLYISRSEAKKQGYTGPRFRLELECGHTVARELVRSCSKVKCGECLGPGYNSKGFKRDEGGIADKLLGEQAARRRNRR